MHILLLEAYYGGSHQAWADALQRSSSHEVTLLTLPAQFWKWRMQGGAVTLARQVREQGVQPDLVLATDMLNLATFRALTAADGMLHDLPMLLYFHENQLSYPQNARQQHGWYFGFINYVSAMAADAVYFNSRYHLDAFFAYLPKMLRHNADERELESIPVLRAKSDVLGLALDLHRFDAYRPADWRPGPRRDSPLIVWNHRWEADKDPAAFFDALDVLMVEGLDFRVALLGENPNQHFPLFEAARDRLGERLVQYGYLPRFADYARLLWEADYVVSSAQQEFFGMAVAEAIYCGCVPVLPGRLNYPGLLPESAHSTCLYPPGKLAALLRHHLHGIFVIDITSLQTFIEDCDWSHRISHYDQAFRDSLNAWGHQAITRGRHH